MRYITWAVTRSESPVKRRNPTPTTSSVLWGDWFLGPGVGMWLGWHQIHWEYWRKGNLCVQRSINHCAVFDLRLPQRLKLSLPSSGFLRSVRSFDTDASVASSSTKNFKVLEDGPIGSPDTPVSNHLTLCNISEDGRLLSTVLVIDGFFPVLTCYVKIFAACFVTWLYLCLPSGLPAASLYGSISYVTRVPEVLSPPPEWVKYTSVNVFISQSSSFSCNLSLC